MLRSHPFEAVRQKQHKTAQPPPLVLGAGDELIDDDLRRVDEIAELRLPEHESVGTIETVPVLEPQRSEFRERAVVNVNHGLVATEMLQGHVNVSVLVIVKHSMPVAERSSFAVLSAEPNAATFGGQCRERQRLACRPIHGTFAACHLQPRFYTTPKLCMPVGGL